MESVLAKLGISPTMMSIIRSLHEGMSAKVIVGQEIMEPINVCNGLHQGCTMAPVLFSLYFGVVVDEQVPSSRGGVLVQAWSKADGRQNCKAMSVV